LLRRPMPVVALRLRRRWNYPLRRRIVLGSGWKVVVMETSDRGVASLFDGMRLGWLIPALLMGGVGLYAAATRIGHRVRRLALAAGAIAVGDYRKRVKMPTGDEFEMLAHALNSVGERLVRDHNAMKRHADLLAKMAEAARISSSSLDIRECARAICQGRLPPARGKRRCGVPQEALGR